MEEAERQTCSPQVDHAGQPSKVQQAAGERGQCVPLLSVQRSLAIRALLEREEAVRSRKHQHNSSTPPSRTQPDRGDSRITAAEAEHRVWRTRKELLKPLNYDSIPLLTAGTTCPRRQQFWNHLLAPPRDQRDGTIAQTLSSDSHQSPDEYSTPGRVLRSTRRRRKRQEDQRMDREHSPARSPRRQENSASLARLPTTATGVQVSLTEVVLDVRDQALQTDNGLIESPQGSRQSDMQPSPSLSPSAGLACSSATAGLGVEDVMKEEDVLVERLVEGDGVLLQRHNEQVVNAEGSVERKEGVSFADHLTVGSPGVQVGRKARNVETKVTPLGPLPLHGRLHVCLAGRARASVDSDCNSDSDAEREPQLWAVLGDRDRHDAAAGGGPVVMLDLSRPYGSEGAPSPKEYLLVTDITGPLSHRRGALDSTPQYHAHQDGALRGSLARPAADGPSSQRDVYAQQQAREAEGRLKQSLEPLTSGMASVGEELRRLETQTEDLEAEMEESRRRFEGVRQNAIRNLEDLLKDNLVHRRESTAMVRSVELEGCLPRVEEEKAANDDDEEVRQEPLVPSGGRRVRVMEAWVEVRGGSTSAESDPDMARLENDLAAAKEIMSEIAGEVDRLVGADRQGQADAATAGSEAGALRSAHSVASSGATSCTPGGMSKRRSKGTVSSRSQKQRFYHSPYAGALGGGASSVMSYGSLSSAGPFRGRHASHASRQHELRRAASGYYRSDATQERPRWA